MLKALARFILRNDAPPTPERRSERFVTPSELDEALAKMQKELEWELTEWHEKFSTLHARLAKRAQRANGAAGHPIPTEQLEQQPRPSVLHHRRPGSV